MKTETGTVFTSVDFCLPSLDNLCRGLNYEFHISSLILHPSACGAVAQLGERLNGIQEVVGSTPIGSTKKSL